MMIKRLIKIGRKDSRRGVALLIVLFIVMSITVLSLGFLARSDVELTHLSLRHGLISTSEGTVI